MRFLFENECCYSLRALEVNASLGEAASLLFLLSCSSGEPGLCCAAHHLMPCMA